MLASNISTNVSSFINKWNLKLHDINKELEYNQHSANLKQTESCIAQLWTSVVLFSFILIFKSINSWLEENGLLEIQATVTQSNTEGSTI